MPSNAYRKVAIIDEHHFIATRNNHLQIDLSRSNLVKRPATSLEIQSSERHKYPGCCRSDVVPFTCDMSVLAQSIGTRIGAGTRRQCEIFLLVAVLLVKITMSIQHFTRQTRTIGLSLSLLLFLCGFNSPEQAMNLRRDPLTFGSMDCQQIWYLENKILADGRICLTSERARRAFRLAKRCISEEERILPKQVKDYLALLRSTARGKGCPR